MVQKSYPYILIIGSLIGLGASFVLILNTLQLLKNPGVDLPCNLSPFVSCTSVANAWQNEVFGFPNALLGMTAFAMLFAVGVMLLSGGRAKKPLWLLVNLGTLAAMVFVAWFFFESVYRIRSLCLYCMTVWAVTWPLFLYTCVWNFRESHFDLSLTRKQSFFGLKPQHQRYIDPGLHFASKYHLQILIVGYLAPILLILWQFRDFFFT